VAVLTLAGLGLRVVCARQSIFGDELFTYEVATRDTLGDVLDGVRSPLEITPPLFFVLAWASAKVTDPTFMLRLPSLVAGVALIPLVYALGVRTVGRHAALVGAALMALAPFAVLYSAEARAYALAAVLACGSTLALLNALDGRGRGWWAGFAVLAAGALLSHYTAGFMLAGQALWALWAHRDALRPLLLAHAGAALLFTPWIPEIRADRDSAFQSAIGDVWPFTAEFFAKSLITFFVGHPAVGLRSVPGEEGLALLGLAALISIAGTWAALRARPWPRPGRRALLALALALATPVGAGLYSLVAASVFVPRTLLVSLPGLCLVLGAIAVWLPRPYGIGFAAALLAACLAGTVHVLTDQRRPGYRAVAADINSAARPGDAVFESVLFDYGMLEVHLEPPFTLYRSGCDPAITAPGAIFTGRVRCESGRAVAERTGRAAARAARGGRLFVVISADGPAPEPPGFRLEGRRRYGGLDGLELREYSWDGG
jgi:Dolichyl-phosphate-mannose-protein mannosyltransferase